VAGELDVVAHVIIPESPDMKMDQNPSIANPATMI
jgi:hypothetical protein